MFLRAEMPLAGKGFGVPIYKQNSGLNGEAEFSVAVLSGFLWCFSRVPKRFSGWAFRLLGVAVGCGDSV